MKKIIFSLLAFLFLLQLKSFSTGYPTPLNYNNSLIVKQLWNLGFFTGLNIRNYSFSGNPAYFSMYINSDFKTSVSPIIGLVSDYRTNKIKTFKINFHNDLYFLKTKTQAVYQTLAIRRDSVVIDNFTINLSTILKGDIWLSVDFHLNIFAGMNHSLALKRSMIDYYQYQDKFYVDDQTTYPSYFLYFVGGIGFEYKRFFGNIRFDVSKSSFLNVYLRHINTNYFFQVGYYFKYDKII